MLLWTCFFGGCWSLCRGGGQRRTAPISMQNALPVDAPGRLCLRYCGVQGTTDACLGCLLSHVAAQGVCSCPCLAQLVHSRRNTWRFTASPPDGKRRLVDRVGRIWQRFGCRGGERGCVPHAQVRRVFWLASSTICAVKRSEYRAQRASVSCKRQPRVPPLPQGHAQNISRITPTVDTAHGVVTHSRHSRWRGRCLCDRTNQAAPDLGFGQDSISWEGGSTFPRNIVENWASTIRHG